VSTFERESGGNDYIAYSPDDRYILSKELGMPTNRFELWDANTGKVIHTFFMSDETYSFSEFETINALAFSPNGKYIVSISGDHALRH